MGAKQFLSYLNTKADIKQLAEQVIRSQTTLTGVQAKLSLDISSSPNQPQRFTIVGLWGRYILKPQTEQFKYMPEVEDLTMHLAELAKVNVDSFCRWRIGLYH